VRFGGADNNRTFGTVGSHFFPAKAQSFLATAVPVHVTAVTVMAVAALAAVMVVEVLESHQ